MYHAPVLREVDVDLEETMSRFVRRMRQTLGGVALQPDVGSRLDSSLYSIMLRIEELGPLRIGELTNLLGLDQSTVSRHVSRLERNSLVSRDVDPDDARAQKIALSNDGKVALGQIRMARSERVWAVTQNWSEEDIKAFAGSMDRFVTDLEALST